MKSKNRNTIERQAGAGMNDEYQLNKMSMQKIKTERLQFDHYLIGSTGSKFYIHKGTGVTYSTGPPGRAPGMDAGYDLFPEHPPDEKRMRTDKILQVHLET